MSKNFVLLQRAEEETGRAGISEDALRPSTGMRSGPGHVPEIQDGVVSLLQSLFILPPQAPRSVVFACVQPGDGSNSVCLQAARALASLSRGSVCLVDGNLRAPSLHLGFGMENSRGLAQSAIESVPVRNFARQIDGSNLWVLPTGALDGNTQTLISSDQVRQRLVELRADFDYVLIDGPPLSLGADSIALARLCDGLVVVLQLNRTRRETARMAKKAMEAASVRILGTVLSNRTYPIPEFLYRML